MCRNGQRGLTAEVLSFIWGYPLSESGQKSMKLPALRYRMMHLGKYPPFSYLE
jgi:hypothetical protein